MTKPIVRDPICRRRRFDAEIIELCVRWYITYRLNYRDLVAMMAERGIVVSHTTILPLGPAVRTRIRASLVSVCQGRAPYL
jgi:transposase-like protein